MTPNLIKIVFIFNSFTVGFCGLLINFFEQHLPTSFSKVYRHGKFCANVKDAFLDKYEVPKRWFKHFYLFAAPACSLALALFYYRYYMNFKLPNILLQTLDLFVGKPIHSLIPPENAILAFIVFTIHLWKRFYETNFVNVFSDVNMNFTIYLIGFVHYFGAIISILGETQYITKDTNIYLNWTKITLLDYISSIVLLASTYMQYRTNIILSNLRKDKNGEIVTKQYKIPCGGLFEYISSPLQFTEIIIYLCLSIIVRSASSFHFVTLWVVINQVECAYLSHEWSLRKFEDYPTNRKIILPFIF